ncbi:MAG: FAD-binding oxidoreductase [Pseudomonadota bacterium]
MTKPLIKKLARLDLDVRDSGFENYLQDESRFHGHAEALVVAHSESDIVKTLILCNQIRTPLTVVSGKTSLTGAPVPLGGLILDVKNLDRVNPENPCIVGPGIILAEYKRYVDSLGFFYPPDPTSEQSCTLGGNVACNASGPLSYLYGPTRDYIERLRIHLPTGLTLDLERNRIRGEKGFFRIPRTLLEPSPSEDFFIPVPTWKTLPWKYLKNSAGFYSDSLMDLLDLFIGSEGILGIFSEITTRLLKKRRPFFSIIIYLPDRKNTVQFVEFLNSLRDFNLGISGNFWGNYSDTELANFQFSELEHSGLDLVTPSCMEWFGRSTAGLLPESQRGYLSRFYGALFVEQEYDDTEQMMESASQWGRLIETFNLRNVGLAQPIETLVALDSQQSRSLRNLRQSIPEKLNENIHPGFSKIGSDFSLPPRKLGHLLEMYDRELPVNSSYVFGHIGNNHLHANILPQNSVEQETAYETMTHMMEHVIFLGGSISAEHGIGKIKSRYFEKTVDKNTLKQMMRIKLTLDPINILNRHTLLS